MRKKQPYHAFYKNKKLVVTGDWIKVVDRKSLLYNKEGMVINYKKGWICVEIDFGFGNAEFRNFRPKQLILINR